MPMSQEALWMKHLGYSLKICARKKLRSLRSNRFKATARFVGRSELLGSLGLHELDVSLFLDLLEDPMTEA